MWKEFNPNPVWARVGDCAVRAIAALTGWTWDAAYNAICDRGQMLGNMPSADYVWGSVLSELGFRRRAIEVDG